MHYSGHQAGILKKFFADAMGAISGGLIIPIYRDCLILKRDFLAHLASHHVKIVIVNNNNMHDDYSAEAWAQLKNLGVEASWCENANNSIIAGAIRQGVARAQAIGCDVVTLLDQDSSISAMDVLKLQSMVAQGHKLIVGPTIIDERRRICRDRSALKKPVIITSGCTFRIQSWIDVGEYRLDFKIDYLDHEWCFRAHAAGYQTKIARECKLYQQFGERHPNQLARILGCELYPPLRHEYAIRNLRKMTTLPHVPLWWKAKEIAKMLIKPLVWLATEPNREANLWAILRGLFREGSQQRGRF